jgi:hypothetical protein
LLSAELDLDGWMDGVKPDLKVCLAQSKKSFKIGQPSFFLGIT